MIAVIIIIVAIVIVIIAVKASSSKDDNDNVRSDENTEEYVQVLEDGTKVNTSAKLNEDKKYNGLEFTNIKFTNNSSVTNLYADVENTASNDMEQQLIEVKIIDKAGNVMTSFTGVIGALKAGEKTTLSAGIAANYANAYDIQIVAPSSQEQPFFNNILVHYLETQIVYFFS